MGCVVLVTGQCCKSPMNSSSTGWWSRRSPEPAASWKSLILISSISTMGSFGGDAGGEGWQVALSEVQSGPYLDEGDIIRFEDCYGRSGPSVLEMTA